MNNRLADHLHFGYDPRHSQHLPERIRNAVERTQIDGTKTELINQGIDAFEAAVDAAVSRATPASNHVVPLSAGVDSRLVLAALIEHPEVSKSDVQTVSAGTPGTWEFDIGRQVADVAGVSHEGMDLTADEFDWSLESLLDAPIYGDLTPMLDKYIHSQIAELGDRDTVFWSGYLGGESAGGHEPDSPRRNWIDTCEWFLKWEQLIPRFTDSEYNPTEALPEEPFLPRSLLNFESQLDFAVRQQCRVKPVAIQDDRYISPFMEPAWLEFSLNLPHRHRVDQQLYNEMVVEGYPELFSLPTNTRFGSKLGAWRGWESIRGARIQLKKRLASALDRTFLHPNTTYVDFEWAFRDSDLLKPAGESLVRSLAERGVVEWIDPEAEWEAHQNGDDRQEELRTLCSLELYLQDST